MPRDGSNIYHRPAGTDGVPDTPIESAKYNAYVADVEQDLNLPRPIVAGGTGATNATDAMTALGGELANQAVTNYDSDPILPGSFYSAISATATPVTGHAFVGFAYGQTGGGLVIEARDLTDTNNPHIKYTRSRTAAGVWSTWMVDGRTVIGSSEGIGGAAADMFFGVTGTAPSSSFIVNSKADVTGTNLFSISQTGAATFNSVPTAGAVLNLNKPAGAYNVTVNANRAGAARWTMTLGDNTAETGSDVGSNFTIWRWNDAGTTVQNALNINRASGLVNIPGVLTVNGTITASGSITSATMFLNASNYAVTDGTNYIIRTNGGSYFQNAAGTNYGYFTSTGLNVIGAVTASGGITAGGELKCNGIVRLSADNTKYVYWDGSKYNMPGAPLQIGGPVDNNSATTVGWVAGWAQPALGFTPVQQGGGIYQGGSKVYIGWDGVGLRIQVDSTDLGKVFCDINNPPVTGVRLAYAGDFGLPYDGTDWEPVGGGVVVGCKGAAPVGYYVIQSFRVRRLQQFKSSWVTVDYP